MYQLANTGKFEEIKTKKRVDDSVGVLETKISELTKQIKANKAELKQVTEEKNKEIAELEKMVSDRDFRITELENPK